MRASLGVVVLALLGRAAGFAGIAARTHTARLGQIAKHCSTETAVRRPAASWPQSQTATTTTRRGGHALKASDQPEAVSSSHPPLDVKAVGK